MKKRKLWILIGIVVIILALFAFAYYWWEIRELSITICSGGGCESPKELLIK